MGSRIILPFGPSGEYIEKHIPDDDYLKCWSFPSLDDFYNDSDTIYKHPGKVKATLWNAIIQQYTEWNNWFNSSEDIKKFLAPIVNTYTDKNGLPVLCFPRFTPILEEGLVYNYNEHEILLIAGKRLEFFHIKDEDVLKFFRGLPQVIDFLDLVENDIILNPSNIGYNPTFGLRIIDYGLNGTFDF